jgi:hypothetical protein
VTNFGNLLGSFMDAVKNVGAFDVIADAATIKLPRHVGRVNMFSQIGAGNVSEGAGKPLRRVMLTESDITPVKVAAMVVATLEFLDGLNDDGLRAFGDEMRTSVAQAADTAFLGTLSANNNEATEYPDTFQGFVDCSEEAMRNVALGAGSKPYWVASAELTKAAAAQATAAGVTTLAWNGGTWIGIPWLVSDAWSESRLSLIDATGLAIHKSELELRVTDEGSVEMDSAPQQTSTTPTAASGLVSMFQTNSRAMILERSISSKPIRNGSYVHMTGVQLADDGSSPAMA